MLPKPNTIQQQIMWGMITFAEVSEQEYRLNSFRARITEIKRIFDEARVRHTFKIIKFTNRFNRVSHYRTHSIMQKDLKRAKKLYCKLVKNEL